eukprot:m.21110 g.21110  ORF g.21110 m.21110 type:complete len:50 (+) comp13262_c0_seq1:54-203(+)
MCMYVVVAACVGGGVVLSIGFLVPPFFPLPFGCLFVLDGCLRFYVLSRC